MKILLILVGGGLGSLARYGLSGFTQQRIQNIFPMGTLSVNLLGSLLIGLLWGLAENSTLSPNTRTFLFVGLLGGFTTFSSYSIETLSLLRDGEIKLAFLNLLLNNVAGIGLAFGGLLLSRELPSWIR
jgi:CrcB protein